MDTSEQYIKMCDCPEIQLALNKKHYRGAGRGGFFARNTFGKWFIEIQSDNMVDLMDWVRSSFEERQEIPKKHWGKILGNTIWLPRQDQIQVIMGWDMIKAMNFFYDFYHEEMIEQVGIGNQPKKNPKFNSMEQLWLAFYMFENHKKTWNGKEWIK